MSTHTGTPCTCPDCQPGPAGDIRTRLTPVLNRLDGTDAATVRHIVAVLAAERDELEEMLTAATDTATQRGKRIEQLEDAIVTVSAYLGKRAKYGDPDADDILATWYPEATDGG